MRDYIQATKRQAELGKLTEEEMDAVVCLRHWACVGVTFYPAETEGQAVSKWRVVALDDPRGETRLQGFDTRAKALHALAEELKGDGAKCPE